ncbi:MAG: competence protein ComEC family protein [Oscillospiraceae bacterium]|jgi:ComEC/Rec2-related protein|nr:competence protein ComEC family protein [Oscillospiraceae bacterium]
MFFGILGFSYLLGQVFAIYFGPVLAACFAIFILICFSFSLKLAYVRSVGTVILSILAFCSAIFIHDLSFLTQISPLQDLSERKIEISGVLCELPIRSNGKFNYIIKADVIKVLGQNKKSQRTPSHFINNPLQKKFFDIKIKLSSNEDLQLDAYDHIVVHANTHKFPDDQKLLIRKGASKGTFLSCYANDFEKARITPVSNPPLHYYLLKLKRSMLGAVKSLLPRTYSGVVCSFLLGQKEDLSKEVLSCFSDSGISHLLAISGTHMAIVSKFSLMFFSFFRLGRRWAHVAAALSIFLFMGLTGFVLSAVRSGIMCIVYMLGVAFYRESNSTNSLGFSVLAITLFNPFAGADIGFLLSVLATLGIILMSSRLDSYFLGALLRWGIIKKRAPSGALIKSQPDAKDSSLLSRHEADKEGYTDLTLKFPYDSAEKFIKLNPKFSSGEKENNFKNVLGFLFNLSSEESPKNNKFKSFLSLLIEKSCLNEIFDKIIRACVSATSVSIAAVLFNLPILLFCFERFSLMFILTNILVNFSVAVIISFAILGLIFYFIPYFYFFCKICMLISGIFINYMITCAYFIKNLPFSTVSVNKSLLGFVLGSCFGLFSICLIFWENKHLIKISSIFSFIILLISILSYQVSTRNLTKFTIFNSGVGNLISVSKDQHHALLYCSGDENFKKYSSSDDSVKNLDLFMLQNGRSTSGCVLLDGILTTKRIDNILLPKVDDECVDDNKIKYYSSDVSVDLWGNVRVKSLKSSNEVWTRVEIDGTVILLCSENALPGTIPACFCDCDFVVFDAPPKDFGKINAKYIITRLTTDNYQNSLKKFLKENRVITTAGSNEISLEFHKGGDLYLKKYS